MKKPLYLLPLACSIPVLVSCSITSGSSMRTTKDMRVEPIMSVRHSSKSTSDYYQIGRYYEGQSRLTKAAIAYRKVQKGHSAYFVAQNALGKVYSKQGKYEKAVAIFKTISETQPDTSRAYNNLGYAYFLQGKYIEAIATFETALTMAPQSTRIWNNISAALHKSGDSQRSILAKTHASTLTESVTQAANGNDLPTKKTSDLSSESVVDSASLPRLVVKKLGEQDTPIANEISYRAVPLFTTLPVTANQTATLAPSSLYLTKNMPQIAPQNIGELNKLNFQKLGSTNIKAERLENKLNKTLPRLNTLGKAQPTQHKTSFRLEVANGNGVTGMAKRTSRVLVHMGFPSARLTNIRPFQQPKTIIRYRLGHLEQALLLQKQLARKPALVVHKKLHQRTDVQLVLGKDVVSQVALYGADKATVQITAKTKNDSIRKIEG